MESDDVKRAKLAAFALGKAAGLREAANEVRTHWNDAYATTNQKAQAHRSADVLAQMAERVKGGK